MARKIKHNVDAEDEDASANKSNAPPLEEGPSGNGFSATEEYNDGAPLRTETSKSGEFSATVSQFEWNVGMYRVMSLIFISFPL